jgi:hypothetical protein
VVLAEARIALITLFDHLPQFEGHFRIYLHKSVCASGKVEYSPVLIPNIQSSHPQHPSRYCFAVDKGTPDDVAALFHSIEIKLVMNLARAHNLICSLLAQIVHIAPLSPLTPPAEFQGKGELPST